MKKLATVVTLLCVSALAAGEIIYSEDFPVTTSGHKAFSTVGWNSMYAGASATEVFHSTGDLRGLLNSTSNAGQGPSRGFAVGYWSSANAYNVGRVGFISTSELAVSDVSSLTDIEFHYKEAGTPNIAWNIRLALNVAGAWYVSADQWAAPGTTWTQALYSVSTDQAEWLTLSFTPGASLAVGAAPVADLTGAVQGMGFFIDTGTEGTAVTGVAIDSVKVMPEPTTLSILGLGAMALIRRRR